VAHTGGVVLPLRHLGDGAAHVPGWTPATISFANGKSETVLASQKAALAVVRTRFRWRAQRNGATTYLPRSGYVGGAGLRGNLQALCAVYGCGFPIVVTFTGRASQEFERLLHEFNSKVLDAAKRLSPEKSSVTGSASARLPPFTFYMKVVPGPHQKAGPAATRGAEAIITPPRLELPEQITPDYLSAAYVGRERLLELQQLYQDAAAWAQAWDRFAAGPAIGSANGRPAARDGEW
jgi:hypothetical protein